MTTEEFSNEFDTLILVYNQEASFGHESPLAFDEYEKSVFLTKALELIVITLYNGKNSSLDSFEGTEEIRRYLNNLVETSVITELLEMDNTALTDNSVFYSLPENLWFITYEQVKLSSNNSDCLNGKTLLVQPITLDDFYRISKNPFRQANTRKALRLDIEGNIVEIVSEYPIESYLVRYLRKPNPIILEDLDTPLSINGSANNKKTECELNPAIHRMILDLAVLLAIASKAGK